MPELNKTVTGMVTPCLVYLAPDQAVFVLALAGDIALSFGARHSSHSASLHPGV